MKEGRGESEEGREERTQEECLRIIVPPLSTSPSCCAGPTIYSTRGSRQMLALGRPGVCEWSYDRAVQRSHIFQLNE